MAVQLIIGLGNPGPRYHGTRHNAGFMVLDRLAQQSGIPVTRKMFAGQYGEGHYRGHRLLLLKPQTFMNLSGRAAAEAVRFHKLSLAEVVVVHDDLDIPFGQVRVKAGGGHGGHNGLRSLIELLGSGDFVRVRVGIGRPGHGDSVGYVLSPFAPEEQGVLSRVFAGAVEIIEFLLAEGPAKTMSIYNGRDFLAEVAG